jgi:hypothetical protein
MSYFLYLHEELSGRRPDLIKLGVTKVPHGAVRLRQRFLAEQFGLDHLWIGHPDDIAHIEKTFKKYYAQWGNIGTEGMCNTELLHASQDTLVEQIEDFIQTSGLRVRKIMLGQRYTACRSSDCPLGIPSESLADEWVRSWLRNMQLLG